MGSLQETGWFETNSVSQKWNGEFFRSQVSIRTTSAGITMDESMAKNVKQICDADELKSLTSDKNCYW
jgi:hypothetical protein